MRRFLALLFAIVFIVVAPASLVLNAARNIVLSPDVIKAQLRDHKVYDIALNEAARALLEQGSAITTKGFFVTPGEIVEAVRSVVTPAWLQEQTEVLIDRLFVWVNTRQGDIRNAGLTIAFGDIVERASSIVTTTIQERFNTLPECTAEQIRAQSSEELITKGLCRPLNVRAEDVFRQEDIDALFQKLPKEISLVDTFISSDTSQNKQDAEGMLNRLNSYRDRLLSAQEALQTLFVIALLLILLVGALAATSRKAFFGWIGVPLFIAGGILIVPTVVLYKDVIASITTALQGVSMPGEIGTVVKAMVFDIVNMWIHAVRTYGIILSSVGLLFVIITIIIPKKKVKEKKDQGEPVAKMTLQEKFRGYTS